MQDLLGDDFTQLRSSSLEEVVESLKGGWIIFLGDGFFLLCLRRLRLLGLLLRRSWAA